jgi:NAD(P)-dependent dehydrogenase (short-subunit alcohol dehydrogenase family)
MSTNLFDLTGKIALVTGASRGIGEEIAKLLAEQGAHVIVSSRKLADCEVVAERIRAAGGKAEALACHVGRMEDITAAFDTIRSRHGRLDILIHNAAANPHFGHILETDLAAYEKTVEVNIRGYFFMSVEAGKKMKAQGGGAIVNTASVAAEDGQIGQAAYSASKGGIVGMTLPIARDLSKLGIRNMTIAPGIFGTPMMFSMPKEVQEALAAGVPFPSRLGTPQDYAKLVMHILDNDMLNGEVIRLDGAIRLPPK